MMKDIMSVLFCYPLSAEDPDWFGYSTIFYTEKFFWVALPRMSTSIISTIVPFLSQT